ncbi:hypothetical protein [Kitasatospora sp. NPDC001175]
MPPRKRLTDPDTANREQPCPECFPDGWPEGASAVGCEHGSWPAAEQES